MILSSEDDDVTQGDIVGDACPFTRSRRLSGNQLLPIGTGSCPCAVLVHTAASAAEENYGF